jgi:hypothetical protein
MYLIENGFKRKIISHWALDELGLKMDEAVPTSVVNMDAMETGSVVAPSKLVRLFDVHCNESFVVAYKRNKRERYIVRNGRKRLAKSSAEMSRLKLDVAPVIWIDEYTLDQLPDES